jgi:DNA-binding response OmpR family regulator
MDTELAPATSGAVQDFSEARQHRGHRQPRILIADDDPDTLTILRLFLESENFEVMLADNGATAWRMTQECLPDLIVTDYQMPEMSGMELSHCVRSTARTCHIPILVHSAYDAPVTLDVSLYDDWFDKPTDLNSLSETIRSRTGAGPTHSPSPWSGSPPPV